MVLLTVDAFVNQEFAVIGSEEFVSSPSITYEDILLSNRELISVDVFLDRHGTRIGNYEYFTSTPQAYSDIQLENRTLIDIQHRLSNYDYAKLTGDTFFRPVDFGHMGSRPLISSFNEYLTFANQSDRVDIHSQDYKRLQLSHRTMHDLAELPVSRPDGIVLSDINGQQSVDVGDIADFVNLTPTTDHYRSDYHRLSIDGRITTDLSLASNTLDVIGFDDRSNGDFVIEEPPRIEGNLYKVFGRVYENGNSLSAPTKVMLVDRTGGALTTISVPVDSFGNFAKFYKDLPENSSFMIIGLWDVDRDPYYEPVIIDRVVPTLIS